MFLSLTNSGGAKIMPILPTLLHLTPRALCVSVEKNTDSLVKGMILFDHGGGGEVRAGKRSPPSVRGPLVFCCCLREWFFSDIFVGSKILAGNSPAGPPSCISRHHTMVVVFVGWSTALLSHESVLFLREQTYNKVDNKYSTKLENIKCYTYCKWEFLARPWRGISTRKLIHSMHYCLWDWTMVKYHFKLRVRKKTVV